MDILIRIKDGLIVLGPFVTALGLFLTFIQLRRNWRVQKAQFLSTINKDFFEDSDFRKFFYKIDYREFKFDEKKIDIFQGSDDERHLDALLYQYNLLGQLVRMKLLKIEELEFIAFEIVRIFDNDDVKKYLAWLDKEYEQFGNIGKSRRKRSFDNARWLVGKLSESDNRA